MQQLQQTVFHNLSKQTQYAYSSKKISQKHLNFPKYREQQIQNQFQLIDLHNQGKLTQKQIISYLSDKYQWLNTSVIKELFRTMNWDQNQAVTKEQFVTKYLARQRHLYNQINGLKYYHNWVQTLQQIYNNQISLRKPRVYFYTQLRFIQLYQKQKQIQWMDLIVQYQNHETKTIYQIQQASHQASYPSFQIWLPAGKQTFFLKFKFLDCQDHSNIYGQAYFNIQLEDKMYKMRNVEMEILKNGVKVGDCTACVYAEPSMDKVKQQLKQIRQKQRSYEDVAENKIRQYEYLQFLWGIRHKSPHKISPLDIKWMLGVRIFFILTMGILGVIVHVLGRCEPLSIIITFLLLRSWQYALFRRQKFLLTWLTICSILLDIIWIALSSSEKNQINFLPLNGALVLTYVLLIVKALLFGYMLLAEKSLVSD